MSKKVKTTCLQCGTEFEVRESRIKIGIGKFCSHSCHAKSRIGEKHPKYKPKVKWNCQNCGKESLSSPSGVGRFCSIECKGVWQSNNLTGENNYYAFSKIKKICEVCHTEFCAYPDKKFRFCSKECRVIWQRSGVRKKENNINYRPDMDVECLICSKPFHARTGQVFCSLPCLYKGRSQRMIRTDIDRIYPPTFNARFRKMIRERDGYTCLLCPEWGNQVHHINYVKADTYPENCITLCASCHSRTNNNRDYWQIRITEILEGKNAN